MNIVPWARVKGLQSNVTLPVAVISLRDQQQRRETLLRRGLPSEWLQEYWPATDFRSFEYCRLCQYADVKQLERSNKRRLRVAEVGCALSHRAAADWVRKSSFNLLMILEDDVIPVNSNFQQIVSDIASCLMPIAERGGSFICHLGAPNQQVAGIIRRSVVFSRTQNGHLPTPLFLHTDPVKTLWRAHAYLISREAARRAVDLETKMRTLADDWCLRRELGLIDKIFYCDPPIIRQDEEISSTIRTNDNNEAHITREQEDNFFDRVWSSLRDGSFIDKSVASLRFRGRKVSAKVESYIPYLVD